MQFIKPIVRRLDVESEPHLKNSINVFWSNETKINFLASDGKTLVRPPKKFSFCSKPRFKNLKVCWIEYHTVLQEQVQYFGSKEKCVFKMLPFAEEDMFLQWKFMQNTDPKHTWLTNDDNKINIINWYHNHSI